MSIEIERSFFASCRNWTSSRLTSAGCSCCTQWPAPSISTVPRSSTMTMASGADSDVHVTAVSDPADCGVCAVCTAQKFDGPPPDRERLHQLEDRMLERYVGSDDPDRNAGQALELAFQVTELLRG